MLAATLYHCSLPLHLLPIYIASFTAQFTRLLFCSALTTCLNFKRQSRGLRHWTLCWDIKFVYLKPPVQGRKSGSVALVPVASVPAETLLHTHCLQGQATYCKGIPSPQESLKSMLIGHLPPNCAYGTVTQRRCQISQETSN